MPIIKSAQKRMRQEKKRKAYNVAVKSSVKKTTRAAKDEISTGATESNAALVAAVSQLDRAVKKGVLHKKTASRRKSRLTKAYNAVAAQPYGTEPSTKKKAPKAPKVAKKAVKTVAKPKAASKPAAKASTKAPAKPKATSATEK